MLYLLYQNLIYMIFHYTFGSNLGVAMTKVTLISENLKLSQEISLVIKIFNVHHNKKNIILYLSKEGRIEIKK